ncbi:MAG: c-type cytochrome [Burkholderiales bacterium]|nr:c-type cytochrome [Burkholderiales bacterium]
MSLIKSFPARACRYVTAIAVVLCSAITPAHADVAKVENTMAQRVQACTGCHGPQGRAASDGYYPRIAGKPAGYLYHQLLNFRDGRRHYPLMAKLLAPLSDTYLREIAEHFANLELPYPPPQVATGSVDALTRGELLATRGDTALHIPACVQCHGEALMGVAPFVPALLGLPRDYLNAQLGAWRTGNRHALEPDCMAQIAQRLAPQDISALSQWLAAQRVVGSARPAAALPAALPMPCGSVPASADAGGKP